MEAEQDATLWPCHLAPRTHSLLIPLLLHWWKPLFCQLDDPSNKPPLSKERKPRNLLWIKKPTLCWCQKLGKALVFSSGSADSGCLFPEIHKSFMGQGRPQSHSELISFLLNKLDTTQEPIRVLWSDFLEVTCTTQYLSASRFQGHLPLLLFLERELCLAYTGVF